MKRCIKCRRPFLVLLLLSSSSSSLSSSSSSNSTINTIEQSFLDANHILQLVELPLQPLKVVEEELQKQLSKALVHFPPNSTHRPIPATPSAHSQSVSPSPSLSLSQPQFMPCSFCFLPSTVCESVSVCVSGCV